LANGGTTVFFRDDDVGRLTPGLRFVIGLLLEEGVPCNYQVVPSFLDAEAIGFLKDVQSRHPDRVVLNQHGFRHEQQIGGERVFSEFAGGRPYAEQHREIEAGRALLREALGASFDARIFTPPCHKYDGATLRALHDLGFEILSAGVKLDPASRLYYRIGRWLRRVTLLGQRVSYHEGATTDPPLADVSVCIDVDEDQDRAGRVIEKGPDRLWSEFERARRVARCVGVMLHHERYGSDAKRETLRTFVRRLKAEPEVAFATIGAIAARPRSDVARTDAAVQPRQGSSTA